MTSAFAFAPLFLNPAALPLLLVVAYVGVPG